MYRLEAALARKAAWRGGLSRKRKRRDRANSYARVRGRLKPRRASRFRLRVSNSRARARARSLVFSHGCDGECDVTRVRFASGQDIFFSQQCRGLRVTLSRDSIILSPAPARKLRARAAALSSFVRTSSYGRSARRSGRRK